MATELRLPPLADTVTSVKLALWLKEEGQAVAAGEPIAEVETDKTNVEIEAPAAGVVVKIHVPAGTEGLETGALLAVIDPDATVAAAVEPTPEPLAPASTEATAPAGATAPEPVPGGAAPAAAAEAVSGPAPAASPLARRMAAAAGLDLREIKGSGRGGRIGKADVERVLAAQAPPAAAPPRAPVAARVAGGAA